MSGMPNIVRFHTERGKSRRSVGYAAIDQIAAYGSDKGAVGVVQIWQDRVTGEWLATPSLLAGYYRNEETR